MKAIYNENSLIQMELSVCYGMVIICEKELFYHVRGYRPSPEIYWLSEKVFTI